MFTAVFEYLVDPLTSAEFEATYRPGGRWSVLFASHPGYHGTELLVDHERRGRYLVLDRWASAAAYRAFLRDRAGEYAALSDACTHLYRVETRTGEFTSAMLPS